MLELTFLSPFHMCHLGEEKGQLEMKLQLERTFMNAYK